MQKRKKKHGETEKIQSSTENTIMIKKEYRIRPPKAKITKRKIQATDEHRFSQINSKAIEQKAAKIAKKMREEFRQKGTKVTKF